MPNKRTVPPLSLGGVYLPPPPAIQPVAVDPLDEEFRTAIRRAGAAAALQRLASVNDPSVAPPPQPTSVPEVIQLNREARDAAGETARLAKETAEAERVRRQEAEQRAAGAYDAGAAEADDRWRFFTEINEKNHGLVLDLVKGIGGAQVAAAQTEAARIASEMKANAEAVISRLSTEITKRDEKINELQQQNETLKQRKTWSEVVAEKLEAGDLSHPAVRAMLPAQPATAPQGKTPQERLDDEMVPIIAEDEREQRRLKREALEEEKKKNRAFGEAAMQLVPLARSLVGGVPEPQGRPPLGGLQPQ